jgi:hypothetical protein
VFKRHFLPPSEYERKAAGSYVIPLCGTTQCHITRHNQLHACFFPTPIPVGSQKRLCRGHKCSLTRHHLEWHPVTAACKNTVHYFQLSMAVVKMMVTWTELSHSEDSDSVSLKWQLCCIKNQKITIIWTTCQHQTLFVNKAIPVLNEASSHECTMGPSSVGLNIFLILAPDTSGCPHALPTLPHVLTQHEIG